MTINTLPPAPSRADAANADTFTEIAETFVAALPVFSTQVNSTLTDVNAAASGALASSNFKGSWAALTGAMSIPASVLHTGTLWLLVTNTSDITVDEPGVSAKWLNLAAVSGYVSLTGNQTIAGNKTFTDDVVANSFTGSFSGNGSALTAVQATNVLGVGQTWKSVIRTASTLYQNTTGRTILLAYSVFGVVSGKLGAQLRVSTDSGILPVDYAAISSNAETGFRHISMLQAVVPNNAGYVLDIEAGELWEARELR